MNSKIMYRSSGKESRCLDLCSRPPRNVKLRLLSRRNRAVTEKKNDARAKLFFANLSNLNLLLICHSRGRHRRS